MVGNLIAARTDGRSNKLLSATLANTQLQGPVNPLEFATQCDFVSTMCCHYLSVDCETLTKTIDSVYFARQPNIVILSAIPYRCFFSMIFTRYNTKNLEIAVLRKNNACVTKE